MPPNQDDLNGNPSLPTLPENPQQPVGAMPPEQIVPASPPTEPPPPTATQSPQEPTAINQAKPPATANMEQPTTNQNNPPPTTQTTSSHLFRNLFLFFFFFIIAASVLGLGLAYNNYPFFKPPMAIRKTLDNVIALAPVPKPTRIILETTIAKSAKLKSADQKTEFTFSTNAQNFPVSSVKFSISGPIEFTVQEKQTAEAEINLEVKFEGATFNGSASLKKIDNTVYFKANEIPFGQFYQQLLDYKNKWYYYKIPDEFLPKKDDADTYAKVSKVFMDFVDKSPAWTKVTSQDGNVYTLEVTPPKKELDNLMFDLVAAVEPKDQKQILTDLEKENFAKQTEKVKNLKITAKVNKDNYYLKSANVSFDISADNLSLPNAAKTTLPVTGPTTFNINIGTELSNYNKQVVIIPPEGAIDFKKIMDEYSKQYMEKSGIDPTKLDNQTKDAKIKNDIGTIATELQGYYTTPGLGSYPKELSDLATQGSLKTLPTPPPETGIETYQYLKEPPTCDATKTNPCKEVTVYSPLLAPTTQGNVWCWQSSWSMGKEVTKEECVAKNSEQTSTQTGIRSLITPNQTVLGQKTNWELETLELFKQLFK